MTDRWEDYAIRKSALIRLEVDRAKHMVDIVYLFEDSLEVHVAFQGFEMNVWVANPDKPSQTIRI